jgi:uncharacterized sulfatase
VNEWEFYDLKNDPQEQHNLISSAKYQKEIARMKEVLIKNKKEV